MNNFSVYLPKNINTIKGIKLNYAIIFVLSLFFLNETTRGIFLKGQYQFVNFPFIIFGFIFFTRKFFIKREIRFPVIVVVLAFFLLFLANSLVLKSSISYTLMYIGNLFLPMLLLGIKIEEDQAIISLRKFIIFFNTLIYILLILGVIDYLSNSYLQLFMAKTIFSGSEIGNLILTENRWGIYRYYSIVGHPLKNAEYFLIFLIMNNVYARYKKPLINRYLVSFITILGLLICSSKTALILGLVLVTFFSGIKKKKWIYLMILGFIYLAFFNSSLFQENLKIRYLEGIKSGDLSTGRNDLIQILINSGGELPKLLIGGGSGYSRLVAEQLNGNIHNFEYPVIMLAYDYGIVGMILIYFCMFVYPAYRLIREKNYYNFFLFFSLALMVNSNNGIANIGSDILSSFCFITLILINIQGKSVNKETNI